jgi:Na+/H+ antiporter NhaD/arsenite permease-like protein
MSAALLSLLALIVAIALSMTTRINVGIVAMVFAWIVGVYAGHLTVDAVIRGFPSGLFLTLTGMSLLFATAEANGTLENVARRAVRLTRGRAAVLPLLFFAAACVLAAIGPGAVSSVALVAPLAMAISARAGVPYFLTALMVANGANAGNLSPVSAVGIIANTRMAQAGLGAHPGKVMFANLAASAAVAMVAYLALGGHRLRRAPTMDEEPRSGNEPDGRLSGTQWFTLAVLAGWIAAVVAFGLNPGLSAFAAVALVIGARAASEGPALAQVPWGVILMVCGVATLIAVLEATGGMALFTALLARLATPGTINGVIALVTGGISLYSSTSGVVLPAFLPTVPGLVQKLGGGDPLAVALSINVGSSLVDVSPLSTLGALCLAAIPDRTAAAPIFRSLLVWGLAVDLIGALLCQLLAGPFARL